MPCKFFVVPWNWLALLDMQGITRHTVHQIQHNWNVQRDRDEHQAEVKCNMNKNSNAIPINTDNQDCFVDHFLPDPNRKSGRKCNTKKDLNANPIVTYNVDCFTDHFLPDSKRKADRKAKARITKIIYSEFEDFFRNRLFWKQILPADQRKWHVLPSKPRQIAYVLQKRTRKIRETAGNCTFRNWTVIQMVQ